MLTIAKVGTGSGLITGTGINCGVDCTEPYNLTNPPLTITLTAAAYTGSTFIGWTGCTPLAANPRQCTVTMNTSKTIKATFNTTTAGINRAHALQARGWLGHGHQQPRRHQLRCYLRRRCCLLRDWRHRHPHRQANHRFHLHRLGRGLRRETTPTCTVAMSAARIVTAAFTRPVLTVAKAGTGSGLITGPGINCGVDCTEPYNLTNPPLTVNLTAAPAAGSSFIGWTGCTP